MKESVRNWLLSVAGVGVLVGITVLALWQADVIGRQSTGVTESGVEILPAEFHETSGPAGVQVAAEPGRIAPDFEVSDLDGRRARLSDYRGKIVFLDFWSTTCLPCLLMIPNMHEFKMRHPEISIFSVNNAEPLDVARGYLDSVTLPDGGRGVRFEVNALDPTGAVYDEYRVLGMPYSLIIDEEGIIRDAHFGLVKVEQMEQALELAFVDEVDSSLASP